MIKASVRYIAAFAAAASFSLATGCQSVYTSHIQNVGGPRFAPSDPAQVQILRTQPARPHVRLGEIRAEPASLSIDVAQIEDALRKEAAKLGADAVVVVYDRTQITGAYVLGPWWGGSIQTVQGRVVIAVAIKYQLPPTTPPTDPQEPTT
jgi:hypothetical protein